MRDQNKPPEVNGIRLRYLLLGVVAFAGTVYLALEMWIAFVKWAVAQ